MILRHKMNSIKDYLNHKRSELSLETKIEIMAINWQVNNKEKGLMKIPNKSKNKMKMNNPVNN